MTTPLEKKILPKEVCKYCGEIWALPLKDNICKKCLPIVEIATTETRKEDEKEIEELKEMIGKFQENSLKDHEKIIDLRKSKNKIRRDYISQIFRRLEEKGEKGVWIENSTHLPKDFNHKDIIIIKESDFQKIRKRWEK